MKAFKKLVLMILTCLLVAPFSGNTVYASSGTISLSDPTVGVGDSVSVTVKATTTDSSTISSVTMELTYDAKILEFESGTSATNEDGIIKISGTADSSIKTYTLTFKALKSGTSAIKISSYDIKDSKSAVIDMSKVGSSTVTVTGDNTENATITQSTTENAGTDEVETDAVETDAVETEAVETLNIQIEESKDTLEDKIVNPPKKDVEVEIAGSLFDICKIPEDIIPEGFKYVGYMYGEVAVDALRKDNIILFYLKQKGEEPYILYLYDDETGGFFKYAPVSPCFNYSVIDADESVVIPEGFTASAVSVGGIAVNGWQSDANSEYFLLYLMTSEGKKNLYLYDTVEKTVQRFNGLTIEQTETKANNYETLYFELNENYNSDMQSKTSLLYGLIVLTVILIFIIINLVLRLLDKHHAHLEEEDDEEEIEFDEVYEEYEEVEEFEDDYDDYEEKTEYKSDRQLKKEVKKAAKLEKKEKVKAVKKVNPSSKAELMDEADNTEDDYDDSDGFEMQIFDFDDDK